MTVFGLGHMEGIHLNTSALSRREGTCLKREVASRTLRLVAIPLAVGVAACDTAIGVAVGSVAIVTWGTYPGVNKYARKNFEVLGTLIVRVHRDVVHFINPRSAPFQPESGVEGGRILLPSKDGLVAAFVQKRLDKWIRYCKGSNFFNRHMTARLICLVAAIAFVIARVIDTIIGAFTGLISLLTFGREQFWNQLTYETLRPTMVVRDLFVCTLLFMNPASNINN